jgi:hypothetical protein
MAASRLPPPATLASGSGRPRLDLDELIEAIGLKTA